MTTARELKEMAKSAREALGVKKIFIGVDEEMKPDGTAIIIDHWKDDPRSHVAKGIEFRFELGQPSGEPAFVEALAEMEFRGRFYVRGVDSCMADIRDEAKALVKERTSDDKG